MNLNTFPTKGNLILAKNSLALASQGYELMDKKRNILLRELMGLIDQAKDIQAEIDTTFTEAYKALQKANIELALSRILPGRFRWTIRSASRPAASWERRSRWCSMSRCL